MRLMGWNIGAVQSGMAAAIVAAAVGLSACASGPGDLTAAQQPLPNETLMMLGKKGMKPEAPIFVRIFKEESELEVWKARDDGRFYHLKTYPICNWSGDLGPKLAQGDKQAPEGFYDIGSSQMNPNSLYHVAFNMGFLTAVEVGNWDRRAAESSDRGESAAAPLPCPAPPCPASRMRWPSRTPGGMRT